MTSVPEPAAPHTAHPPITTGMADASANPIAADRTRTEGMSMTATPNAPQHHAQPHVPASNTATEPVTNTTATTNADVAGAEFADVPVSVWTTAQTSPSAQRKGRYVSASTPHPAKMLPAVAAHAIAHYTRPSDLVLDPMCGVGTTLVEALYQGRRAVGVEYEPHWVTVTQANLDLAHDAGPHRGVHHDGQVFSGDARQLASVLPAEYRGRVDLVVTSPPYGPSTHGQVDLTNGIQKYWHRYGNLLDRGNLANIGHHRLLSGFTRILAATVGFLKSGGYVVITVRPWREHAELIDLPSQILACGRAAGLIPVERCVALLARAATGDLVARGSFFQRDFIRKQRDAGLPLHLIAHEDLLVFRSPLTPTSGTATGSMATATPTDQAALSQPGAA